MAPEVGLGTPYNEKCDVYYRHFTSGASFCERVFVENVRPPLKSKWSILLQDLLQAGWDKDPVKRPTMAHIQNSLLDELQSGTVFQQHSCGVKRRRSTFVYGSEVIAESEPQMREDKSNDPCPLVASVTTRSSHFSFSGRSD
jgi:hypothetical protein